MSSWQEHERLRRALPEDRLFDENTDRLRDAAANLIDAVRALVRRRLEDPGVHPEEALDVGVAMLEQWLEARGATGYAPRETADDIADLVGRLMKVMRPKQVLAFHLEAKEELGGITPIEAYVRHRIWGVKRLVMDIEGQAALEASEKLGGEQERS